MGYQFIKRVLLFSVLGLIKINTFAQLKIDNQPDTSYYRYVVNIITPYALTEKETVKLKAQLLPVGLLDTLKKYDWFDMGGFNYIEGKFKSLYTPFRKLLDGEPHQLDFKRFCNDGFIGEFYLQKTINNLKTIYTNTFDKPSASKLIGLKTVKSITYLQQQTFNENEFIQIVSYKNKQLVVDMTKYGKIGEKPVKYRVVYFAIEQQFKWQLK